MAKDAEAKAKAGREQRRWLMLLPRLTCPPKLTRPPRLGKLEAAARLVDVDGVVADRFMAGQRLV